MSHVAGELVLAVEGGQQPFANRRLDALRRFDARL